MDATLELSGFVFNRRVASWEPLVEPLEDPLCRTYRSWGLVAKVSGCGRSGRGLGEGFVCACAFYLDSAS